MACDVSSSWVFSNLSCCLTDRIEKHELAHLGGRQHLFVGHAHELAHDPDERRLVGRQVQVGAAQLEDPVEQAVELALVGVAGDATVLGVGLAFAVGDVGQGGVDGLLVGEPHQQLGPLDADQVVGDAHGMSWAWAGAANATSSSCFC